MKSRFTLALVVSFAGGVLLTAGIGGGLGVFDRGPTELDVSDARERGRVEATNEVEVGKDQAAIETEELGYERGREAREWLSLDRMPNPDGWFAGVNAGRERLEEIAEAAYQAGLEDGERQGLDEALGAFRERGEEPGAPLDPETASEEESQ